MTLGFTVLAPLYTYILLVLKGLPEFAMSHHGEVLLWVYQSTWPAALASGALLSMIIVLTVRQTQYFHQPFDFGRSFSLGAVCGTLAEVPITSLHRALSGRPHSDFWMAGAMMSGCLAGATLVPLLLSYQLSYQKRSKGREANG